jgi:hypothetical protein
MSNERFTRGVRSRSQDLSPYNIDAPQEYSDLISCTVLLYSRTGSCFSVQNDFLDPTGSKAILNTSWIHGFELQMLLRELNV